jgi:hypothetical protein
VDEPTERMTNTTRTAIVVTTPVKQSTIHCNSTNDINTNNAASTFHTNTADTHASMTLTSSPTLLGSGHYSPVDGSVQTFAPAPTSATTSTTTMSTSNSEMAVTTSELLLLHPTALTFDTTPLKSDKYSNNDDDDDDVYLTPLQSSITSIGNATEGCEHCHVQEAFELQVANHKSRTQLTVAESTLTDVTTDASVDGEDTATTKDEEDLLLHIRESDDEFLIVPPPPPSTNTDTETLSSKSPKFIRHACSFLRVSDLIGMDPTMDLSEHSHKSIPNYHCCSDTPPPGIPHDIMEQWVALDDGNHPIRDNTGTTPVTNTSSYTPIAQFAVDALATTALTTIMDATMWVPDSKTAKIIESKSSSSWETNTFQLQPIPSSSSSSTPPPSPPPLDDHILIWSGTFRHGLYGSDIPAIRSAAIIYMSATQLLHLLMDSNRVKEYNTMSLGRTDLLTLPCRHIVTKVMRSESRPPLLRKTLQFTSIFHARKLVSDITNNIDGDATSNQNNKDDSYLLVTRAVENPNRGDANVNNGNSSNVVVSEILLGVNVIRTLPDRPNTCLLLSVNHVRSPLVPSLFLAKRLGLQAATNFVHDLRKCCSSE